MMKNQNSIDASDVPLPDLTSPIYLVQYKSADYVTNEIQEAGNIKRKWKLALATNKLELANTEYNLMLDNPKVNTIRVVKTEIRLLKYIQKKQPPL